MFVIIYSQGISFMLYLKERIQTRNFDIRKEIEHGIADDFGRFRLRKNHISVR